MSKSPALRRIQADVRELSIDPSDRYHAHPLENDMFEWHFTIRGADGTDFEGGYYHGRILLPAEYPFKPPNIMFLTPSGRFETHTKVCLSFSAFHPELWQPAWGIRLILEALVSFLPTKGDGAIGALDWTSAERKRLAKASVDYVCPQCGKCSDILKRIEERIKKSGNKGKKGKQSKFQKEIDELVALQSANHADTDSKKKEGDDDNVESKEEVDASDDKGDDVKDTSIEDADSDADAGVSGLIDEDKAGVSPESNAETTKVKTSDMMSEVEDKDKPPISDDNTKDEDIPTTQLENNEDATDVAVEEIQELERLHSPLLSDPIVHCGIVMFGAIVMLLLRKINAIMEDMRQLESELSSLN